MAAKPTSTSSAAMVDEVSGPAVEPPPGAPTLRPIAGLPRRKRAEFFVPLRDLPMDEDGQLDFSGGPFAQGAAGFSMLAAIEDCLGILAIDRVAYESWANQASDNELMQLFSFVFSQMNPGEAAASPTS